MDESQVCGQCGTEVATGLLSCPGCDRLIHADTLKNLAAEAAEAERAGDYAGALAAWNRAHALLPRSSRQAEAIVQKIAQLGRAAESAPRRPHTQPPSEGHGLSRTAGAGLAGAGVVGLTLFKFKFVVILFLSKLKFLLLGLSKFATVATMFASLSLYWKMFGWAFAAGLIVSIYVHEMGHIHALRRYGLAHVGAPLFLPGLGAFILLRQEILDPRQDARMGLAGPAWGMAACLAFAAVSVGFDVPTCAAIGRWAALINLFNLLPLGSLDGGRAFRSLTRTQRVLAALALAALAALVHASGEMAFSLLVFLIAGAVFRIFHDRGAAEPDRGALVQYVLLAASLASLSMIPVTV